MSEQTRDSLLESLIQYENQLSQIKLAILATPAGRDRDDLNVLQKDIEELILLTQENLSGVKPAPAIEDGDELSKEYALFKAELENLEDTGEKEDIDAEEAKYIGPDIQDELESLKGSKCQAPHKQKWGDVSYHNALVVDVEVSDSPSAMDHIEVRVLFVNPTEKDMVPCPYYLDGDCKFSDEQCHYSHGELVSLSDIKEYREPDFRCIKEGCSVLAKHKDRLWKRARVLSVIDDDHCKVKFDSGGYTADVDVHELLPLDDREQEGSESSDSSSSDVEVDEDSERDRLVQLSLLRTPASKGLGEWEKHTRGFGSRLMASMGYVPGMGLGKHGEGRLEPVEAVVFPPGKSLDHCMALREAAGGDANLFKAERKHRKQQQQELKRRKKEYEKETVSVFDFINSKLAGPSTSADSSNQVNLTSSTSKGLNVERFKLGEDIKRTEKDLAKLKESLKRQDKGSSSHTTLSNKLQQTQNYLDKLHNSEKNIVREQNQRQNRKKLAVF